MSRWSHTEVREVLLGRGRKESAEMGIEILLLVLSFKKMYIVQVWQYFGTLRVHHMVKKPVCQELVYSYRFLRCFYLTVRLHLEEPKPFSCFHLLCFMNFRQLDIMH